MKRAVELFALERGSSRSCFVEATWWTRSEPEEFFISVAMTHWQMVVTRRRGLAWLTVRGPETKATMVPIPADAEFFGIEFSLGTFMPTLQPGQLVDRALTLPRATGLTRGTIRQIRRAEGAVELLSRGVSALDTARQAGYADQAHLTRSLKRFVGQTPSQIVSSAVGDPRLSFSFKTTTLARG